MNVDLSDSSIKSFQEELENGQGHLFLGQQFEESELTNEVRELFLDVAQKIGTPLSQSTKGELLLDIIDKGLPPQDSGARGPYSNRKLGFHTDRCDVIGFLCLQPALSGGENQIVSSQAVADIIRIERPDLYEVLHTSFPYKRHVIDTNNPSPYCEQPIFSSRSGFFACSYLRVLIDRADQDKHCPSLTAAQQEAIDFLDSVCERQHIQTRYQLERGDLLFLNNWTTLHRRTAFVDYPEIERKRHLLRVWLSMPNSRPIDESFRNNFGSTEAGAIRGGIHSL